MTERTGSETVTFRHPFRLDGADELQPAGCYVIESNYEMIEGLSFPAFRRGSTVIRLPGRLGSTESARVIDIAPVQLAAAPARDALG
jgi:hypothetical protein